MMYTNRTVTTELGLQRNSRFLEAQQTKDLKTRQRRAQRTLVLGWKFRLYLGGVLIVIPQVEKLLFPFPNEWPRNFWRFILQRNKAVESQYRITQCDLLLSNFHASQSGLVVTCEIGMFTSLALLRTSRSKYKNQNIWRHPVYRDRNSGPVLPECRVDRRTWDSCWKWRPNDSHCLLVNSVRAFYDLILFLSPLLRSSVRKMFCLKVTINRPNCTLSFVISGRIFEML